MVKKLHESIKTTLYDTEKNTLVKTKKTLLSRQASLKTSVEKCILYQNALKLVNELLLYSSHKEQKKLFFIACRKCMDKIQHVESYMENNWVEIECSVLNQIIKDTEQYIFQLSGLGSLVKSTKPQNDIEQYMSKLSGLGRIVCGNDVFTVSERSKHMLGIPSDSIMWSIAALCVLPGGEILVLLGMFNNVKLLDQQYQVVSHCYIDAVPIGVAGSREMCKITPSEVALTLGNNDIHFISVTPGQLVAGRTIQLQNKCIGISHHHGDLFITSYTALYKTSLSGKQISKLYEDNSDGWTMCKCAVSPTGDKLYNINRYQHKLLTLARDGTVLATYRDLLHFPSANIHVTPAGQLLVGDGSCIIQLHSEGNMKLATLVTGKEMYIMRGSVSVCYNSTTSSILVAGQSNSILVFKVQ